MIADIAKLMVELIYPHRCLICDKVTERDNPICIECNGKIFDIRWLDVRRSNCSNLEGLVLLAHYEFIRPLIHKAKYKNNAKGLYVLAQKLTEQWQDYHTRQLAVHVDLAKCCVMPIPTDYKRKMQRGYELPHELFKPWAINIGLPWVDIMRRSRLTGAQFQLNRMQRKDNAQGSMQLIAPLNYEHIIIVDDILTTGATINEAAELLRSFGAKSISAIAFGSDKDKNLR